MSVPNEHDVPAAKIDPFQKTAMITNMSRIFSTAVIAITEAKNQKKLAGGIAMFLDDTLVSFAPYLKGETASPTTGFRGITTTSLNSTLGHYPMADVAPDLPEDDPYYCPSKRMWVRNPEDCPDELD